MYMYCPLMTLAALSKVMHDAGGLPGRPIGGEAAMYVHGGPNDVLGDMSGNQDGIKINSDT